VTKATWTDVARATVLPKIKAFAVDLAGSTVAVDASLSVSAATMGVVSVAEISVLEPLIDAAAFCAALRRRYFACFDLPWPLAGWQLLVN
jgi:hypothetical protein